MRPKKVLLLVDPNEQRLSEQVYSFKINGYRVLRATDAKEATAIFATAPRLDLVIVSEDAKEQFFPARALIAKLKLMRRYTPVLLLTDREAGDHQANSAVRIDTPVFALLEHVKVMSARKRGPRPPDFGEMSTVCTQ
jgi:hypothetical protein